MVVPLRRRPQNMIEETKRQVRDMLKDEIIEPSYSPCASAYVIAKKKTGDYGLCVNFRRLNAVTVKDQYPVPHIEQCLEAISGNEYFSLFDFAQGYWQIPMQ